MNRTRSGHTLFSIFAMVELVIVLIAFIAIVIPLPFGIKPSVVVTASMYPTIPAGSIAWVNQNFDKDDLRPGAIAVYEPTLGVEVLHRITETKDGTYTFKGDNNDSPDLAQPIAEQVKGIYLFHIPLIGEAFSVFMANKLTVISTFIGINFGLWALSIFLAKRDERKLIHEQGRRMLI